MKFCILGSDERQKAIKFFAEKDGHSVTEDFENSDILVLPTPVSTVEKPERFKSFKGRIYGGAVPAECNFIFDYLNEDASLLNAELTAEATIKLILERESIFDKNILILGFGRIAKQLVKMLKGFSPNVTCLARRKEIVDEIRLLGIKSDFIKKDYFSGKDVIINTIPSLVIDKDKIECIDKSSFVIDLASMPGGTDFELLKKRNIEFIHALKLPAVHFPYEAGKIIYTTIKEAEHGF